MAAAAQTPPPPPSPVADSPSDQLEVSRCAIAVLVLIAISMALYLWRPIWFTSRSLLPLTPVVYLFAWFPVWLICSDLRDPARRKMWLSLLLVGLLAAPFWCVLLAPSTGVGLLFNAGALRCQEIPLDDGQVRYVCQSLSYTIILEGPDGWPVARLVEFETHGSDNPRRVEPLQPGTPLPDQGPSPAPEQEQSPEPTPAE